MTWDWVALFYAFTAGVGVGVLLVWFGFWLGKRRK
jgi:hypothetical protein